MAKFGRLLLVGTVVGCTMAFEVEPRVQPPSRRKSRSLAARLSGSCGVRNGPSRGRAPKSASGTLTRCSSTSLLLVDGPEVDEAARKLLNKALSIAASAAVATGLATPSPEPAARIDAALAAAKRAFFSYPIARGFERFGRLYAVRIDHRTSW